MAVFPRRLPVEAIREEFDAALSAVSCLLIQSPTGSGKSTQIPQWLLDSLEGDIVVLEPRRVAARLLARRVAEERNCRLGTEVGYQVRFDNRTGDSTRLRFVTDGLLLRQMTHDSDLNRVSAVVFDEFHERHLESDLVLSLLRQKQQQARRDLKIIIMSATLDADEFVHRVGGGRVIQSGGKVFPVDTRYIEKPLHPKRTPVWEAASVACSQLVREQSDGNILIFMPGRFEIRKTLEALRKDKLHQALTLRELHGGLPLEEQAKVLSPGGGRTCIVTTNLAESSLTVEGVSGVVDSGLVRMSRYDPVRKMDTLPIEPISRASADQRSGRAGRTREGICYRLWTEKSHLAREEFTVPEVMRSDLSSFMLSAVRITGGSVDDIPWFEPPQPARLDESVRLLRQVGAIDSGGVLTSSGVEMSDLPLHPRDAKLLIEAANMNVAAEAALLVSLLQSGTVLTPTKSWEFKRQREQKLPDVESADILREYAAYTFIVESDWSETECRSLNVNLRTARLVQKAFTQLCRQFGIKETLKGPLSEADQEALRICLFRSRTDQLAQRVGESRRYMLSGGKEVVLDESSALRKSPWIVAVDIIEVGRSDHSSDLKISSACRVEKEWIEEELREWMEQTSDCFLDPQSKRVMRRIRRGYEGLILEETCTDETDENAAAEALTEAWETGVFPLHQWGADVDRWIRRYNLLANTYPELSIQPFADEDRRDVVEQFVYGSFRVKELSRKKILPVVKAWAPPEIETMLHKAIPEKIQLPSGKQKRIHYPEDGNPSLDVYIQEIFGMKQTPVIAEGRVTLKLHLLAPNRRDVQITNDINRFWSEHYPAIRNQLKKRYPKHAWPEDPLKF